MRKTLVHLSVAAFLALVVSAAAVGQTKISGSVQCGKAETQQKVDVGDRSNHSLILTQGNCTWTKPLELAGIHDKEGQNTASDELSGNRSHTRGYFVDSLENGDKAYVRYQGTMTWKDGTPQTLEGTWTYTGGTGKLRGIKGEGTYKGAFGADGSVTYDVGGQYELPAPKAKPKSK